MPPLTGLKSFVDGFLQGCRACGATSGRAPPPSPKSGLIRVNQTKSDQIKVNPTFEIWISRPRFRVIEAQPRRYNSKI
jgi:hypothetical protein